MNRSSILAQKLIVLDSRTTFTGDTPTFLAGGTAWVDLSDFTSVEFILVPDALTTTILVEAYRASSAAGANSEAIPSKTMTIAADGDNLAHRIEIHQDELGTDLNFVNLRITSDTGNQDLNVALALLNYPDTEPVTQDATVDKYVLGKSTTVVTV